MSPAAAEGDGEVSPAGFGGFSDPTGDTFPHSACQGDVTSHSVNYEQSVLSVGLTTVCSSNPHTSRNWIDGFTGMFWDFDVDGDGNVDFFVDLINVGDGVTGVDSAVFDVRSGQEVFVCQATPFWDGNVFYGASFDPNCIGAPNAVRVRVVARWDLANFFDDQCTCAFDVAPNGDGFTVPIVRTVPVGDGPGAASAAPGEIDVFARGQDNALWTRHRTGAGVWQGWSSLGGILSGTPAAASADAGELNVFVRGQDNALYMQHHDGTKWSGWQHLGGILTTPPAVVSSSPGTLDVFVAGNDRALYVNHFNGTTWSGWTSLGGIVSATPAAASSGPGTIDVLVRGQDNALYTKRYAGSWGNFQSLGGIITTAPSAASTGAGLLDVFARGTDNAMWTLSSSGGTWGTWSSLGGVIASPPAAVSAAPGTLDVFARGQDAALWTIPRDETWGGWMSLGGIIR